MDLDVWLIYLGTVLVLMSTPGPSHLLMLSVSASNGFRRSLATAFGDLTANAIQMTLAGVGLAAVLSASRIGFSVIKWLGVAYLMWIGVSLILKSFKETGNFEDIAPAPASALWFRGFVTSAANPKAVLFFAALFPQFIDPEMSVVMQTFLLGSTYLIVDGLFLVTYGRSASWLAEKLGARARAWIDRGSGGCLIATAAMLSMKSQEA